MSCEPARRASQLEAHRFSSHAITMANLAAGEAARWLSIVINKLTTPLNSRRFTIAMFSIVVLSCAMKLLVLSYLFPGPRSIYDTGFGFGNYIYNLVQSGSFTSCIDKYCDYSSRMPLMPALLSVISLCSNDYLTVGIIKNITMPVLLLTSVILIIRKYAFQTTSISWLLAIGAIALSPVVIKHAAMIEYEEGLLIDVFTIWAVSFYLAPKISNSNNINNKISIYTIIQVFSCIIFLTKSSFILIFFISAIYVIIFAIHRRHFLTFFVTILCFFAVLSWGVRNYVRTEHFYIMSSWDGENTFKGNNEVSLKIFPEISLDRVVDSRTIRLNDGTFIDNPYAIYSRPLFRSEWEWKDFFESLALSWIIENKLDFLRFLFLKANTFFISTEPWPLSISAVSNSEEMPIIKKYIIRAWLLFGRAAEFLLFIVIARNYCLGIDIGFSNRVLLSQAAYAAPYIAGFNYERHVTVYLAMVLAGLAVAADNYVRRRSAELIWPPQSPFSQRLESENSGVSL